MYPIYVVFFFQFKTELKQQKSILTLNSTTHNPCFCLMTRKLSYVLPISLSLHLVLSIRTTLSMELQVFHKTKTSVAILCEDSVVLHVNLNPAMTILQS